MGPTVGNLREPVGVEEEYAAWRRTPAASGAVDLIDRTARRLGAVTPVTIAAAISEANYDLAHPVSRRFATRIRQELTQREGHGLDLPKGRGKRA
jgi:hypothetical protein